jgi:uncharacterized membrane protein YbhN (UPF0104 family)
VWQRPSDPAPPVAGLRSRHPLAVSVTAAAVAIVSTLAIAEIVGLHQVGRAFDHVQPVWLIVGVVAQVVSLAAYAVTYRAIVAETTGRRLHRGLGVELVLTGFGAFGASGGFEFDHRVLQRLGLHARLALRTVLDLGGVELLSLVWIAFAVSVLALFTDPSLPGSLIWPWLIAVPVGTAIAVALSRLRRPEDVKARRLPLREAAESLADVLALARHPVRARASWGGVMVYWAADMATLYVAVRTFGLRPPWESLVLAYATGYLLSRRSLPLGGAGFVQVLMTFSLYWVDEPLAPSLAAVVVYRAMTVLLARLPALAARIRMDIDAALDNPFEPDDTNAVQPNDA